MAREKIRKYVELPWYTKLDNRLFRYIIYHHVMKTNIKLSRLPSYIGQVNIGIHSYSANEINVHHTNGSRVIIGKYVSFGQNCKFIIVGGHSTETVSTYPDAGFTQIEQKNRQCYDRGDIEIGNDVWIGDDVTIMGGVQIGHGAVVGALSLVNADVEPYAIYAGVPARLIRYRFDKAVIDYLLKIRWWDWDPQYVSANYEVFSRHDIQNALHELTHLAEKMQSE
jgi:acetyltransferase-like isoleucine patch superfamily enzyme